MRYTENYKNQSLNSGSNNNRGTITILNYKLLNKSCYFNKDMDQNMIDKQVGSQLRLIGDALNDKYGQHHKTQRTKKRELIQTVRTVLYYLLNGVAEIYTKMDRTLS